MPISHASNAPLAAEARERINQPLGDHFFHWFEPQRVCQQKPIAQRTKESHTNSLGLGCGLCTWLSRTAWMTWIIKLRMAAATLNKHQRPNKGHLARPETHWIKQWSIWCTLTAGFTWRPFQKTWSQVQVLGQGDRGSPSKTCWLNLLEISFFGRWKCQSVPHVFYLVLCVLSTRLICRQLEAEMHESKQVKQWRLRCQRSSTLGWRKVWSKSMKGPVILKWCSNMFKPSTLADLYTESLGLWSFVKQT